MLGRNGASAFYLEPVPFRPRTRHHKFFPIERRDMSANPSFEYDGLFSRSIRVGGYF